MSQKAEIKTLLSADGQTVIYPRTTIDAIFGFDELELSSDWEGISNKPDNITFFKDDATEIEIPEPEYVKYTAQSLTDAQKEQVRSNIDVPKGKFTCNPNLLDNWYFANPVNQRGQTSYTAQWSYCLDRWLAPGIAHPVTIGNQYVSFDVLDQFISEILPDGFYTASVLLSNGSLYTGTAYYSIGAGIGILGSNGVVDIYLMGDAASEGGNPRLRIQSVSGEPINFVAVKLELGDAQTLAHQDASGNWVLNEIPDYGEQLARCQRYQLSVAPSGKYIIANGVAWGNSVNQAAIMIPTPVSMRVGPTISSYSVYKLYANGSEKTVKSLTPLDFSNNGVRIRVESDTAFTAGATLECMLENVFFDANL